MSQVLKRLSSVSNRDLKFTSAQRLCSWLHQCHLSPSSLEIHSYSDLKLSNHSAGGIHRIQNRCVAVGSRRRMSILTDLLRRKKDDDEDEVIPDAKTLQILEKQETSLTEEEIEAKRNISRLSPQHQRLVHGQMPYTEPMMWIHHTVRYKQRMYGHYGESSGVNPGLCWPTREELENQIEYEKICNPFTIQEMVEKKRALRQAEKDAIERRIKEVEAKMAIADKFKQDLAKRQQAKDQEAEEAKARREKLMEEVRRHFGYTVDPRDDKFQELLAKKEKEQKKHLKEARKQEKQQKILTKLEGKSKAESKAAKKAENEVQNEKDDD